MARRVSADIYINRKNITKDITPYLTSLSISDVLEGESSTAEIELEDRERLWVNDWFPSRGDTCSITLNKYDWSGDNQLESLPFNNWEIDEITNSYPPNKCKIKLNSITNNSELRSITKSASWEKVKLSKICSDIAKKAGLTLEYYTDDDPEIPRAEQREQSNLNFLAKLCKDYGLIVRCSDDKLIVCDETKLESADSVYTFSYGDTKIKSFNGSATISKIYKAAHVVYSHGKKKEKIEHTFSDKSKSDGMTLEINKKVNSKAEAERLAKKELRAKNREEVKVRLEVIGDFNFLAGNVITLDESFGFYAGKYIIERADFRIGGGFTVSLDLRRTLSGY